MYPNTPKITQEQQETIDYWLEIAGSPGKGCRSGPKQSILGPYSTMGERELYFYGKYQEPATNNAESDTGVKGTISPVGGGPKIEDVCNK